MLMTVLQQVDFGGDVVNGIWRTQFERGRRNKVRGLPTNHPVGTLEEVSAGLLPPELNARFNFYDTRDLLDHALYALDFWCAHIRQGSSCMSVERGQSDLVKVYQTDL